MVRDQIDRIGVVGAGTMGSGIAQVAATNGYDVVLRDVEPEFLEDGFETIDHSLERLENRDALEAERRRFVIESRERRRSRTSHRATSSSRPPSRS